MMRASCERGTSSKAESNPRQAIFAAPSTGGAVTRNLTVLPIHPATAFLLERG